MEFLSILPWQIWVLISGVVTGLGQAVGKKQLSRITALQMGFIRDATGLFIATLTFMLMGTGNPGWQLILAIGNGAMVAVGVALYFVAVRSSFSGASVFGYLISQVMIVIASAIIFAEWIYFDPNTMRGLGNIGVLLLTIISMMLYLNGLKLGKKWLVILIMSALINVAGNLIAKHFVAGQMNVWDYFWGEQIGLVSGGLAVLLMRRQSLRIPWSDLKWGALQGILAIMGPVIYLNILATHPLSIASLVRRIAAIMVTSVLGLIYYRERDNMGLKSYGGLLLAAIAFILVMWVNK